MRGERVKVRKSRTWRDRGRSEREHEEERMDSTVNEGRFLGEMRGKARRAYLGEVEGSRSG